jgi:hypothetical protein
LVLISFLNFNSSTSFTMPTNLRLVLCLKRDVFLVASLVTCAPVVETVFYASSPALIPACCTAPLNDTVFDKSWCFFNNEAGILVWYINVAHDATWNACYGVAMMYKIHKTGGCVVTDGLSCH